MPDYITLAVLIGALASLAGIDIYGLAIGDDVRGAIIALAGAAMYKLRLNKEPAR